MVRLTVVPVIPLALSEAPGGEKPWPLRSQRRVRRHRRSHHPPRRSPQTCPSATSLLPFSWSSELSTCRRRDTRKLGVHQPPSLCLGRCRYRVELRQCARGRRGDRDRSDSRPDFKGTERGRQRVSRTDRAVPPRTTAALLPDARILPGCRGRSPGHPALRLAKSWRVRRTRVASYVALPHRHQPLPKRASLSQATPSQGVGRAQG